MTEIETRLKLADEYERGLKKMEASGHEEWADTIAKHRVVIAALRAHPSGEPARAGAEPVMISDEMVEAGLEGWFSVKPSASESDAVLIRSMRAALVKALHYAAPPSRQTDKP